MSNQSVEEVANHLFSAFKNPIPETSIDLESLKSTMAERVFESEPFQFNLADLKFALSECASKSAPGPDGLSYNIFKQFQEKTLRCLLKIYNRWLSNMSIDTVANQRVIIAIPKQDGSTLANAVIKIFERMLLPNLDSLDKKLQDFQFGFRKGRGAHHQLINVFSELQRNSDPIILLFDVKKAFG